MDSLRHIGERVAGILEIGNAASSCHCDRSAEDARGFQCADAVHIRPRPQSSMPSPLGKQIEAVVNDRRVDVDAAVVFCGEYKVVVVIRQRIPKHPHPVRARHVSDQGRRGREAPRLVCSS